MVHIRGRVVSRKSTFPEINKQIIAVADIGKMDLLLSTVQAHLPTMNLVNISTALHRLAKLTAYDGHSQTELRSHPVLAKLLAATHCTLMKAVANNSSPSCQALSNVAWALATINFVDLPLLEVVGELSYSRVAAFKPYELSSMLWAFAKFDHVMEPPKSMILKLFEASAEHMASRTEQFSFRCLLMVACAFITVRHSDQELFLRLSEAMMHSVRSARCVEIVKVAWVLSITGIRQEKLLRALASNAALRLGNFKAYELSKILCHFINCNFFDEEFLLKAACALQVMALKSNQVVALSVALARSMPQHPLAKTALLVLLPAFTAALGDLRSDELIQVVRAATICLSEERGTERLSAGDRRQAMLKEPTPVEVTTFFAAVESQARKLLPKLSEQELVNLVQSLSIVHGTLNTQLLEEITQEAANHFANLSTEALRSLLRSLSAVCNVAAQPYYDEIVKRLDGMQKQEILAFSHICAEGLFQCPPDGFSLDILHSFCQALGRVRVCPPPGLDEPFNEMDTEALGGTDLFQATRACPVPCWLDRRDQHQRNELQGLDVVETKKVDTLQQATDLVDPAQIYQFQSSNVGKNFDMPNFGEDNTSFFSVDVVADISCSISRFSVEPGFALGHSTAPPEQLPLYSGGFAS